MLKLNASYSKKVPADGEYTSQSYHASIEVELPDEMLDCLPEQEKTQFQNKKYLYFTVVVISCNKKTSPLPSTTITVQIVLFVVL